MKRTFLLFGILISTITFSQQKVLVYHETNGFRHGSINAGIQLITNLGNDNGLWTTDDSQSSSVFTTSNLAQYDAVVWCNTSGNNLLSANEQAAFEDFIESGKGFVGIHAATDTYRDKSWPFYNELVGGIVQTSPNHTSNNFNATMTVENSHPAVDFLGATWNKNEEYYYWEQNGGQLSTDNIELLRVESTGNNSYDAARPIAWYKTSLTASGQTYNNIKAFYTALGHNNIDYTGNTNFQDHIEEAVKWALGSSTLSIGNNNLNEFKVFPNPTLNNLTISFGKLTEDLSFKISDVLGKLVYSRKIVSYDLENNSFNLDMSSFQDGIYLLSMKTKTASKTIKVVKL